MIQLEEIVKKYQKSKKQIQTQKASLKQKIQQVIQTQTINNLKIQNYKVTQIHKNQHNIQAKLKRNNQIKSQMKKHVQIWNNMYQDLNKGLKKAGDLAHYANFIEDQVKQISFEINPDNEGQVYKSQLSDLND